MIAFLLVLLLAGPALAPPAPAHRFHVSYGRMAVEGNVAVCYIRFFKHDLEDALEQYHRLDDFSLDVSPRSDSLYSAYFDAFFRLQVGERTYTGSITGSGEEVIGSDEMWWYTVQFEADEPLTDMTLTNTLLFDLFDDQKNIFKVRHFPDEENRSLYFTEGAESYTVSF